MTLPLGPWGIAANGARFQGPLILSMSDGATVNGTVRFNSEPVNFIFGFWDENSQSIAFLRADTTDFSYFQIYTGTLTSSDDGTKTTYTLKGTFAAFQFPGTSGPGSWAGTADWHATRTYKEKEHKEGHKEGHKEKDAPKENLKERLAEKGQDLAGFLGGGSMSDPTGIFNSLLQHAAAVQPPLDHIQGEAFIRAEERPAVGRDVLHQAGEE